MTVEKLSEYVLIVTRYYEETGDGDFSIELISAINNKIRNQEDPVVEKHLEKLSSFQKEYFDNCSKLNN